MTAARPAVHLDLLRGRPELSGWVDTLERVTPADDLDLPAGHDLVDALLDLGVPHVDVADALAARPATGSDADALVRRTRRCCSPVSATSRRTRCRRSTRTCTTTCAGCRCSRWSPPPLAPAGGGRGGAWGRTSCARRSPTSGGT